MEHLHESPEEQAVQDLVDEQLLEAYWDGAQHYGTTDLVLYLDTEATINPLRVFVRETILADMQAAHEPKLGSLISKIYKPANFTPGSLQNPSTFFWFIVSFPEEKMWCTTVKAARINAGGQA